ncbi:MAG TPA: ABC transporter ATP-binding protein, partial [Chloroflexota bacterium]|nr:ABC transporter ATP-binding protein [Chloroflexota bacterium]
TTLLRVLLGLSPRDAGEILWNGAVVADATSFLVPPRCAYTPQAPRLLSATIRENVLMGLPEAEADLPRALHLAVLERDLAVMPDGLDTVVGPRGVRLSGGQIQRTAAARMFVRQPELLVFDDLSSALDVKTERALWDRLLGPSKEPGVGAERVPHEVTCLAVSHRRTALERADRIVVLDRGSVEATGTLSELLRRSDTLRRLWEERQTPDPL